MAKISMGRKTNKGFEMKSNEMLMVLKAVYLDYVNNFLTVKGYADHYDITQAQAEVLIDLARAVYYGIDRDSVSTKRA